MPSVWVTKEFADAVTLAGYDVQKYVTALCEREYHVKNQLKSNLKADELIPCKLPYKPLQLK